MTFSNQCSHAHSRISSGLIRPLFIVFCVLALASACNKKTIEQPFADDGRTPQSLIPAEMGTERVFAKSVLGRFWRDAVKMEGGVSHSFAAT